MRKALGIAITMMAILALSVGVLVAKEQTFGEGVSSKETMKVSELLASPDKYVGETVRVQGTAVAVCKHRGCWVSIASDVEGEFVRVKVTDGVIVFPPEIMGETIIAEGVWTANKLDLETTKKLCANEAKKSGEEFDASKVTDCRTLYQISGTGAVVVEVVVEDAVAEPSEG